MHDFFSSVWWLIVALGLLVTFHEFGHFWVARRLGVRVLRFSVGYGKPFWCKTDKHGTDFCLAAIPLGGYVKMLDEREVEVPEALKAQSFNSKPVWARIAIVAAGPVFNLIFAFLAFWLMYMTGVHEMRPVTGTVQGLAAEAGIRRGDEIIRVDGEATESWTHVIMAMINAALDKRDIQVVTRDEQGREAVLSLPLSRLPEGFRESRLLQQVGLEPFRPQYEPVIGQLKADGPAARAGIRTGDRIVAINGRAVQHWRDIGEAIQNGMHESGQLKLDIRRDGQPLQLTVEPYLEGERYLVGISPQPLPKPEMEKLRQRLYVERHYGPFAAAEKSFREMVRFTGATLGMLGRMVTGKASLDSISGPITIAQFARDSARMGFEQFLSFLGILSLSLAILNLLPIPMLDGGHLLYYLVEGVTGKPVSESIQIVAQYFGMAILLGLMILAFYNDILRIAGG